LIDQTRALSYNAWMKNLFIPKKIRVGFQNRSDTFTGKLAYVIYYDEKNVIRKETSWKGWCDKKIPALELDNSPRNNYVFNKGVRRYGDWRGSGRSMVRVYDPRDFEFEITVENVIGLLMHSDVSKRDIVQECVFGWQGSELVLLPVNSEEYQKSVQYTAKQDKKISAKELVKGHVYTQKKHEAKLTYIGYFQYYEEYSYRTQQQGDKGKRHVFYDGNNFIIPSVGTLAECILDEPVEEYAKLVDKFFETPNARKLVDLSFDSTKKNPKRYYKPNGPGKFIHASYHDYGNEKTVDNVTFYHHTYETTNGLLKVNGSHHFHNNGYATWQGYYNPTNYNYRYNQNYSIAAEVKEFEAALSNKGYVIDYTSKQLQQLKIPKDVLKEVLHELGYGALYTVNEDGKKAEYLR
jgi:hypothetical protein